MRSRAEPLSILRDHLNDAPPRKPRPDQAHRNQRGARPNSPRLGAGDVGPFGHVDRPSPTASTGCPKATLTTPNPSSPRVRGPICGLKPESRKWRCCGPLTVRRSRRDHGNRSGPVGPDRPVLPSRWGSWKWPGCKLATITTAGLMTTGMSSTYNRAVSVMSVPISNPHSPVVGR